MEKNELTRVPTTFISQVDENDSPIEHPIQILFYNGSVSLLQNKNEIVLMDESIPELIRVLKTHRKEADKIFEEKSRGSK